MENMINAALTANGDADRLIEALNDIRTYVDQIGRHKNDHNGLVADRLRMITYTLDVIETSLRK